MTVRSCIKSMRLRTLPLSLSGIILGVFMAYAYGAVDTAFSSVLTVFFLALTTVLLQILSNISNELGDTLSGVDTDERQGIHYSLQDGDMTIEDMKSLIRWTAVLCCVSGLVMILLSFGTVLALEPLLFLALGAAAVWAAMHYTLGDNPYGYIGLGDLFVFIFFGLATVLGALYILAHGFVSALSVLPALSIGLFSIGVLNVNNIRDMKTDAVSRKTMAIRFGENGSRIYHTVLLVSAWACMLAFSILSAPASAWRWCYVAVLPLTLIHLKGVWTRKDRALDPMLPMLVMSTFLFSLLAGAGLLAG